MKQLELFQMTKAAQSLSIAAKASLEKQSNLSSNFTASENFFFAPIGAIDEEDVDFGDIYDEYIDFDVCSRVW